MRSDYIERGVMDHILAALTPPNRLAVLVSMLTGLRIGDVLSLKVTQIVTERATVKEAKTGKTRRIRLPVALRRELLLHAGKIWVFEGRLDSKRHRTRQAVYKDIKRAARAFRVPLQVSPHTARKIYAVTEYRKDMDIRRVQRLLNHSSEAVTALYCLADEITHKKTR